MFCTNLSFSPTLTRHDLTLPVVIRGTELGAVTHFRVPTSGKGEGISPRQLTCSQDTEWFCADFLAQDP